MHGFIAFAYGAYHYFYYNPPECGMDNDWLQRQCLMVSISYFLYDTCCMVLEGTIDRFIVVHHFFSIVGLSIPYIENYNGIYSMVGIFVTEISCPAMHSKNLLKMFGKRFTAIYEVTEVTFFVLYFIGRGILSWSYVYHSVTCPSNHIFFKLTCFGLFFQSWQQLYKMKFSWARRLAEIKKRR